MCPYLHTYIHMYITPMSYGKDYGPPRTLPVKLFHVFIPTYIHTFKPMSYGVGKDN